MCVAVIARNVIEGYPLIVASNRDEFRGRHTARSHFWNDNSGILAGRDLTKGGTWLGVTRSGRFAMVTNYRDPAAQPGPASRGLLVSDFLKSSVSSNAFIDRVRPTIDQYSGFNLILFDGTTAAYLSSKTGASQGLSEGVYGLSNHLLNTPWPKVKVSTVSVEQTLNGAGFDPDQLIGDMFNTEMANDADLPSTGVPYDIEKRLSSVFIPGERYGTRCTTIVGISNEGQLSFTEQTYGPNAEVLGRNNFLIPLAR